MSEPGEKDSLLLQMAEKLKAEAGKDAVLREIIVLLNQDSEPLLYTLQSALTDYFSSVAEREGMGLLQVLLSEISKVCRENSTAAGFIGTMLSGMNYLQNAKQFKIIKKAAVLNSDNIIQTAYEKALYENNPAAYAGTCCARCPDCGSFKVQQEALGYEFTRFTCWDCGLNQLCDDWQSDKWFGND